MNEPKTIDVPSDHAPSRAVTVRDAVGELERAPQLNEPMDLLRMAVEKGNVDVATLERLMVVRKEILGETARRDFFDALAAFQAECPIILRSRAGHENRYNYAPLERIVKDVTPYLTKHGFSHQEDGVVTEGWVEAIVTVTHRGGHKEEKRFKVPSESKAGMSPQQKYGAAMTYATRYAFCAAFGIRTADKDTDCVDGNENVTALRKTLWTALKPVRGTENKWDVARSWLVKMCDMEPAKSINDLTADEIRSLTDKATIALEERQ